MVAITIEEIQRDFGTYLRQVRDGARLLILEANRPVAELRPVPGQLPADGQEQITLEPEIQQVYSELRTLVARSAEDPSASSKIQRARRGLPALRRSTRLRGAGALGCGGLGGQGEGGLDAAL